MDESSKRPPLEIELGMRTLRRLGWTTNIALCAALLTTTIASAQEIELRAKDGSLTIKGELLSAENRQYKIKTIMGEIVVDADTMECRGDGCPSLKPAAAEFRVTGAKTPNDILLPRLLNAYAEASGSSVDLTDHPDEGRLVKVMDADDDPLANIQLVSSTSSAGLVDLLQGDAQMAVSIRPPRPNEATAFEKSGLGSIQSKQQEYVLALESVLIITSPNNPVETISDAIAAQIFSGGITNWSDLGGPNAPINVYARNLETPTGEAFNSIVMQPNGLQFRQDATFVDSDETLSARVAQDRFGIGFTAFGQQGEAKDLAISGECGLKVLPGEFAIKSEVYPLTRRLSAFIAGDMPDQLSGFLDFLGTDEAQQAAGDAGFVSQNITEAPLEGQIDRLASAILRGLDPDKLELAKDMVREMRDARQLSISFRFIPGTNVPDARTYADLRRLAELLKTDAFEGQSVTIASFTEAAADPSQNQPLSQQRAELIQSELLAIDPELESAVRLQTKAYGDISPLVCSGTLTGQHVNSRVEVWVKDPITFNAG